MSDYSLSSSDADEYDEDTGEEDPVFGHGRFAVSPLLNPHNEDDLPDPEEDLLSQSDDGALQAFVQNIALVAALHNEEAEEPPLPQAEPAPNIEEPTTSNRAVEQHNASVDVNADEVINLESPSPPKKRKRLSTAVGTPVAKPASNEEDEDDGMTCPICLDSWEMSGEHRLVSLRCGHLFGDSCIRRWLAESQKQSAVKVCPQCKTKATNRDLRYLYAKRLRAIDRTEEHRMREELDVERRRVQTLNTELSTIKMSHTMLSTKVNQLELEASRLRLLVSSGGSCGAFSDIGGIAKGHSLSLSQLPRFRLYMEKNFVIARERGGRVLLYSSQHSTLIASQKSTQTLFPGYGVRFIDPPSFKPLHFMHTSSAQIRDICLSADQHTLAVASREPRVRLFDIRTRLCTSGFAANNKILWSCGLDNCEHGHSVYLGDTSGNVFVYDRRFPDSVLREFQSDDNFSPVIHVVHVPADKEFPNGGFLVCQLTLLTFYEYVNDVAMPTRLNVDGPFLSMQYDVAQGTVLISARSNSSYPQSRFILGKLTKIEGTPVLDIKTTIFGSKLTPFMTRATQLGVDSNTLVVGYLQDSKQLMVHDVRREERCQTLPVNEVVYDMCAVTSQGTNHCSYVAALTDNKCRIYKVTSTGSSVM